MAKRILAILGIGVVLMALMITVAQDNALLLLTAQQPVNVRATASTTSGIVGTLSVGQTALVIAENANGENVSGSSLWYQVRLSSGVEGWVWSGAASITQVTPTPSPTLRPTLPPNENLQTIRADTLSMLQTISQHESTARGTPHQVAYTPDGQSLVVATNTDLWQYDLSSASIKPLLTFKDSVWMVTQMGFIKGTSTLYYTFSHAKGYTVAFYNLQTGKSLVRALSTDPQTQGKAYISPDGNWLVTLGTRTTLHRLIYDTPQSNIDIERVTVLETSMLPSTVVFSPDSAQLAIVGGYSSQQTQQGKSGFLIEVYATADQSLIKTQAVKTTSVNYAFFNANASTLTLVGTYMEFVTVDLATGRRAIEYPNTGFPVEAAALSPDGTMLAVAIQGMRGITLFDTTTGLRRGFLDDYYTAPSLAFSPDGQHLASVIQGYFYSYGAYLRVHDLAQQASVVLEPFHARESVLDETGTRVFIRTGELLQVYDAAQLNTTPLESLLLPLWADLFTVSPDGQYVITAGSRYEVGSEITRLQVWQIADQTPLADVISLPSRVNAVMYHPTEDHFALITEGDVSFRDLSGSEIYRLSIPYTEITNLDFSEETGSFVTVSTDNQLRVWQNNYTQQIALPLPEHITVEQNASNYVRLSADGQILIAGFNTATLIWDVPSGQLIHEFRFQTQDAAINPNDHIITLSLRGRLSFYDLAQNRLVHHLGVDAQQITYNASSSVILAQGSSIRVLAVPRDAVTKPSITESMKVLFSDDFESGRYTKWPDIRTIGTIIEAADGQNHVMRIENMTGEYIEFSPRTNLSADNFVLEMRLRIVQTADQSQNPSFDLMLLQPNIAVGFYNMIASESWTVNVFNRDGSGLIDLGYIAFTPPTDEWLDVRIEALTSSGGQRSMNIFINDVPTVFMKGTSTPWRLFTFSSPPTTIIEIDDVRLLAAELLPTPTPTLAPTATPTLTPTPVPTLTPTLDVRALLINDFSDEDLSAWDTTFAADVVEITEIDGNAVLHITGAQNDYVSLGFNDVTLLDGARELEARIMFQNLGHGDGMINFNLMSENPGHASGYSAVITYNGAFLADRNGGFRSIEPYHDVAFRIPARRWHTIRLSLKQQRLNLTINGESVRMAKVTERDSGVPVLIFDKGMEIYLDDVVIRR